MKPMNFPARQLARRLRAQGVNLSDAKETLDATRNIRTKIRRAQRKGK